MLRYLIYCRKSSEAEDRQALSIESQTIELKRLAERLKLNVIEILTESQSAKAPGRPVFDEMIKKISQGKADGIICWKLDRLARNFLDGGLIIQMLQEGKIKHIQTNDRGYYPEDNVLLMSVELGMANQFIRDLSKNIKRGLKTKVEKGWLPTTAPLGYMNDKLNEKGLRKIIRDPERFDLVKKIWDLMLTGSYTPPKILKIANEKWGFRSPAGKPLAKSTIYQLFTNPFYYGWFEYPKGTGNWYKGAHTRMITQAEYERVQIFLGRKGKPRCKKHNFAFTGLIRCSECGGMVTAEQKNQIICPECKLKFSSNNKTACPKCATPYENMKNPIILRYVYYHCGKKKDPDCTQRSIEVAELEKQINQHLSRIHISDGFKNWTIKYLKEENKKELQSRGTILGSQQRAYEQCLKKLNNLFNLKISPLNTDGSLLSDYEYARQKTVLIREKVRLEETLSDVGEQAEKWLETAEGIFSFACHARYWFENGSPEEKATIVRILGSNLTIKDKKLFVELKKPFIPIGRIVQGVHQARGKFEPKKFVLSERKMEAAFLKSPILSSALDEVRTWIIQNPGGIDIPEFIKTPPPSDRSGLQLHSPL